MRKQAMDDELANERRQATKRMHSMLRNSIPRVPRDYHITDYEREQAYREMLKLLRSSRPPRAKGTTDADLLALARRGAVALTGSGIRPTFKSLWCWCRGNGAARRKSAAKRLLGPMLTHYRMGSLANIARYQ